MGTNRSLYQKLWPEVGEATAEQLVQRMVKRGLLKRWPLHASRTYLRLGSAAIERWQYPHSYYRRLGPQILPYVWGCHSLTAYKKPAPVRLLPAELEEFIPDFPMERDLRQWAYYRDTENGVDSLVTIRVEYRVGGEAVIKRAAEHFHRYRRHPVLDDLLEQGRFQLHVITATAEQEESLWDAADKQGFRVPLRIDRDPSLTLFL